MGHPLWLLGWNGCPIAAQEWVSHPCPPDPDVLAAWLELPRRGPVEYPDTAGAVADWIAARQPVSVEQLARGLWESMDFPLTWDAGFGARLRPGMLA